MKRTLRPTTDRGTGPIDDAPGPDDSHLGDEWAAGSRIPQPRLFPAGRVFQVMLICLLVWLLLDAPALKRAAEVSEIGVRRTVALVFLTPLDAVSRFLQLDHLRNGIERAVGREPSGGEISIAPVPIVVDPDLGGSAGREGQGRKQEALEAPLPEVSSDSVLRIVVIGDSFAQGVGASLGRAANRNTVNVQARGVIGSGLTRPDYFNWPAALTEIVRRFKPHLTVVMFGGNDWQSMTGKEGSAIPVTNQDRWGRLYRERVARLAHIATTAGSRMVWIGLPPSRDDNSSRQAHRLNDFYRETAREAPGVAYVDGWELFGGGQGPGNYRAYLPDASGNERLVRAPDGEHLTSTGYDWVVRAMFDTLEQRWQLSGNYSR